jgi:putative flippase GtrA
LAIKESGMKFINNNYKKIRHIFLRRYPVIYQICERRKSSIKFFFSGSTAALVNLLFLVLFHGLIGWPLVLSTSLAFILSFLVSFTLQKFWAFRNYHYKKIPVQFGLYFINAIIGLNVNGFLMHLLVNKWGTWYLLAQVIVSMIIGGYNFLAYNFVIFKKS